MNGESNNLPCNPDDIADRLCAVRERIQSARRDAGRVANDTLILAVSKRQPTSAVEAAFRAGQLHFGENVAQEARIKIVALDALPIVWHFIGQLQANKTREVAERFQWVHTLDRMKIARRLNDQRPHDAPPLQVCIQVNQARERRKGGAEPDEVEPLALRISALPRLKLRGLMTIPPAREDPGQSAHFFAELRRLRDGMTSRGIPMDTLSMGMSADLEPAVREGSTIVRVGTAIFGPRQTPQRGA